MKNRYELNENNEVIRDDTGTCMAENFFETDETLIELFSYGIPKYVIVDWQLTERTEAEILTIIDDNSEKKEDYRKEYCQREIRKLYTLEKEFQLQRQGIANPADTEFQEYFTSLENIIAASKTKTVIQLMEV